jgi:hypothetical protein
VPTATIFKCVETARLRITGLPEAPTYIDLIEKALRTELTAIGPGSADRPHRHSRGWLTEVPPV